MFAIATFGLTWRPSMAQEDFTPSFPAAEVARGAELAAIGNCMTCHTKPDGVPYAKRRA